MKTTLRSKQHLLADPLPNVFAAAPRGIPQKEWRFERLYPSTGCLDLARLSLFDGEDAPESADRLRMRYPYMFSGDHIGRTLFRGWTPVLEWVCERIDELLPSSKLEFRWVELGERDGVARFVYLLGERRHYVVDLERDSRRAMTVLALEPAREITLQIDEIIQEAELRTSTLCMVCARQCKPSLHYGRPLVLCKSHFPDFINEEVEEGLEGVWRCAIEWEEVRGSPSSRT